METRHQRRRRRGAFTLIELLVVIAIIAILAAILFPVFAQAKLAAKKSLALSNTKQIGLASTLYSADADDVMPTAFVCTAKPTPDWTGGWLCPGPNDGWTPIEVSLQPYAKNWDIWASPADPTNIAGGAGSWAGLWSDDLAKPYRKRSWVYIGRVATRQWNNTPNKPGGEEKKDPNTGLTDWGKNPRSVTQLGEPADTISFAEVWADNDPFPLGTWAGGLFQECDMWKLNGRKANEALPPQCAGEVPRRGGVGYNGDGNYAFADGHAKSLRFGAIAKDDFRIFKVDKPNAPIP